MHYLDALGIKGAELKLNTRGVEADRIPAAAALRDWFSSRIAGMCEDCRQRFEKNIWRILDCKAPECQEHIAGVPDVADLFTRESKDYFARVRASLDGLGVSYTVDPRLVRGLDYYVHTVFEVTHAGLGAQNAIAGGGRYEVFLPENRKPVQGVGFAAGLERLIMAMESLGIKPADDDAPVFYLAGLGAEAVAGNVGLAGNLRRSGLRVVAEFEDKSLKALLRAANRVGAAAAVIRGEEELRNGTVIVKDMAEGGQESMTPEGLAEYLSQRYNRK